MQAPSLANAAQLNTNKLVLHNQAWLCTTGGRHKSSKPGACPAHPVPASRQSPLVQHQLGQYSLRLVREPVFHRALVQLNGALDPKLQVIGHSAAGSLLIVQAADSNVQVECQCWLWEVLRSTACASVFAAT